MSTATYVTFCRNVVGTQLGASQSSKLDVNSGFWQMEMDPESSKLTKFITLFGRFKFNRLPFWITSDPEHFQRRMNQMLAGT